MRFETNKIWVVVLSILLVTSAIFVAANVEGPGPTALEYSQDYSRVEALGQTLDLNGLQTLAVELEKKWFTKDKEYYGEMMLYLCGTFTSCDFGNKTQYELARQYATVALEKSYTLPAKSKIPVEIELLLLMHLPGPQASPQYYRTLAKTKDWPNQRSETARLYFRAWDRLVRAIDETWDPNDPSLVFPRPPVGVERFAAGMSGENIKDPNLRAEYEAALERYWQKCKWHTEQRNLRRLEKDALPTLQKHLIALYSGPMFDSKQLETESLQRDLEKHIKDKQIRATILDGLRKKLTEESKQSLKKRRRRRRPLETSEGCE